MARREEREGRRVKTGNGGLQIVTTNSGNGTRRKMF